MNLNFTDKCVSFETFVNVVAATIVRMQSEQKDDPTMMSQRQAHAEFGRRNVERWVRTERIKRYIRPGKIEYLTADLRYLQRTEQDYFTD